MADSTVAAGETQQDSIPKVIHYCWFGMKPHPAFVVKCMDSWRRVLPDYRLIEWNETNTDLDANAYVREAFDAGKYAFVTDYVRLKVLFDEGGIYMDTDVEVLKRLDPFLQHQAFSGFEDDANIPTAVMGSRPGNEWIGGLLTDYDGLRFLRADGTYDVTTNVTRITAATQRRYGVSLDNTPQELPGVLTLYPMDYFCPKSYVTGVITRTANTHAIHHFAGTWKPERSRDKAVRGRLNRVLGVTVGGWVFAVRQVVLAEGLTALPRRVAARLTRLLRRSAGQENRPE